MTKFKSKPKSQKAKRGSKPRLKMLRNPIPSLLSCISNPAFGMFPTLTSSCYHCPALAATLYHYPHYRRTLFPRHATGDATERPQGHLFSIKMAASRWLERYVAGLMAYVRA